MLHTIARGRCPRFSLWRKISDRSHFWNFNRISLFDRKRKWNEKRFSVITVRFARLVYINLKASCYLCSHLRRIWNSIQSQNRFEKETMLACVMYRRSVINIRIYYVNRFTWRRGVFLAIFISNLFSWCGFFFSPTTSATWFLLSHTGLFLYSKCIYNRAILYRAHKIYI